MAWRQYNLCPLTQSGHFPVFQKTGMAFFYSHPGFSIAHVYCRQKLFISINDVANHIN
jgi:hypothetical protein